MYCRLEMVMLFGNSEIITKIIINFITHRVLCVRCQCGGLFIYCLTRKLAIKCVVHKIVHRYELIEEIIDNDLVISRVY